MPIKINGYVKMKILVISTYRFDLEESLKKIICGGFHDLGYQVEYTNISESNYEDIVNDCKPDYVFVIAQPKKLKFVMDSIPKDNKVIIWNLEPISCSPEYRSALVSATKYKSFYKMCSYNEYPNYIFLPAGYHESINTRQEKTVFDRLGFVGNMECTRKKYFDSLKDCGINVDVWSNTKHVGAGAEFIGKYLLGIDCDDFPAHKEKYRWHRLMLYAANDVVFVTTTNWEKYGFKNGKDYIYIENMGNLTYWMLVLSKDLDRAKVIATNMRNKLVKNYSMDALLDNMLKSKQQQKIDYTKKTDKGITRKPWKIMTTIGGRKLWKISGKRKKLK